MNNIREVVMIIQPDSTGYSVIILATINHLLITEVYESKTAIVAMMTILLLILRTMMVMRNSGAISDPGKESLRNH